MIIGKGMLAQAFSNFEYSNDIIIFASGVSNSLETSKKAFKKEVALVEKTIFENKNKLFVYFSTCSMYDPLSENSPYVQHKINVENIISMQSNKYLILRVSQIFGHSKNTTLVNFLFTQISQEKQFDVWKNSNRNIILLDDVVQVTQQLIQNKKYNQIFHIANKIYISVPSLVKEIEAILQKKAKYSLLDKGEKYRTIPNDIEPFVQKLGINFDTNYYLRSLFMYYQSYD